VQSAETEAVAQLARAACDPVLALLALYPEAVMAQLMVRNQIAATALMHDLAVVTRNIAHYEVTGVRVLNPFD
jgi:hypothetical protein